VSNTIESNLENVIETLVNECHQASLNSGWWRHDPTGLDLARIINNPQGPLEGLLSGLIVTQKLCLSHSEISEAM